MVTGLGAVTPVGNNVQAFWESVKTGKIGIGEITRFDTADFKVKLAAEVKDFNAKRLYGFQICQTNGTVFPIMQWLQQRRLWQMQELKWEKEDPFRVGVIVGSELGAFGQWNLQIRD